MRDNESAVGPLVQRFRGGWSASADGLATFATTREEALRQFWLHRPAPACMYEGCDLQAIVVLDDVPLCLTHYDAVTNASNVLEPPREAVRAELDEREAIWLAQGGPKRPAFGS